LAAVSPVEGETLKVLVVDDHSGFRKALIVTLGLVNGTEVCGEASDGPTAVRMAESERPDVVLMDLSMPGMSGIETMTKILRHDPTVPVIILTAHADPAIEREAEAAGAAGFIAKGGGLQELVDAMERATGRQLSGHAPDAAQA
jgi:DNA-binding NarL/FixJ family response regulator